MKKSFSFLLALSLISVLAPTAQAAVKAGGSCNKVGQTSISKGLKFTCTTLGKKKVWSKGVKVITNSASKPAPAPAPMPSPTPTVTPTPETPKLSLAEILWSPAINGKFPIESEVFEVPTKLPTSWDDLYENRSGISYKAWQSVSTTIKKSQSKLPTFDLLKGPNTNPLFSDIEGQMSVVSKAFPTAKESTKMTIIIFNFEDLDWADKTFRNLIKDETDAFKRNYQDTVQGMCQIQRKMCWSATAFTDPRENAWMLVGIVEGEAKKQTDLSYSGYLRFDKGLTLGHEYFHTIQRKILGDRWFQMQYVPPIWFNEGSAVFAEFAAPNYLSYQDYMRARAVDSKLANPVCSNRFDGGCIKITESLMLDFLDLKHYDKNWSNFPYGMKYEVSMRIMEILASVKGHESITDLYSYMAKGNTFEEAFQYIYGISYKTAIPMISKILTEQFS
jgi:hypothetical protein